MGARKITSTTIQAQSGRPRKTTGLRFSLTTGLGSGVWQRQQTSLSSGFQVLQLGQFIQSPLRWRKIVAQKEAAGKDLRVNPVVLL
jgi:hypothetical protein